MRAGTDNTSPMSDQERADKVRAVIAGRQVSAAFQPIVCLQTGEVAAFEALCRPSKSSGYSNPADLFADAERTGLVWDLEEVTRAVAVESAASFPDGVLLFLNNEPTTIVDPRFAASFEAAIRAEGLLPSRFVLEITEAADEQVMSGLVESVRVLRERGFQIAIDDAGAGTSGLNRIMLVRPQWLKLDRELIDGIDTDRYKHNLVRFLAHFARLSGVQIIAEGIEREEELATLIGLGVGYGQGYFLAKPAPGYQILSEALRAWVAERWRQAQAPRTGDPRSTPIGTLSRPAGTSQASTAIREVATEMLKDLSTAGTVVMDGRRLVGWCGREAVLGAAASERATEPVGAITPVAVCALPPEATLSEALELVSVRGDAELTMPLVIANREKVFGIVSLRSLLWAAAGPGGSGDARVDPLTGLPGQVAADQRIMALVQAAKQSPTSPTRHADAAIIDVQNFHDFNGAFGYEAGDQLIVRLTELLRMVLRPREGGVFLACLGGDRFMITGKAGELNELLATVAEQFDRLMGKADGLVLTPGLPKCPTGLRILLIEDVFSRVSEPRQVFAIERQLRQKARGEIRKAGTGKSVVVTDERRERADGALRLSA